MHLRRPASAWAERERNRDYAESIALLILGRLRRWCGLELSLRVLVSAELVALTYYACLGEATRHPELHRICARLLEEERRHVQVRMQQLHLINLRKFPIWMALSDLGHALLLAATLCAIWLEHAPVLRVRHGFFSFFRSVWNDFREAMDRGRRVAMTVLDASTRRRAYVERLLWFRSG